MSSGPVVVVEPSRGWRGIGFPELWEYRELLYFLTWRDIAVRYRQTLLGVAWAVLQPVATMVVFTVFYGRLAHLPSDNLPYPIFAYCGLLPWQLFSGSVSAASNSLVNNTGLLTKVYFPRLIFPLASVLVSVVDFVIGFAMLGVLMIWYHIVPGFSVFALPVFVALALTCALGVGLWLAALNVQYRDVRHTLPFLLQLWLFATPIVYPVSLVPQRWQFLLGLNPMAGVVAGVRWSLVGSEPPSAGLLAASAATSILLFVSGLVWFRQMEKTFADTV